MTNFEEQLKKSVHIQTELAPILAKLMQPALAALGLDYFWFVRLLEGRFHISVGIQPPLIELYRQRKTEDLFFRHPEILARKQTTVIWDLHEPTELTHDMTDRVGLKDGMCILRRQKKHVDIWYVASTKKNSNLYKVYLNCAADIYRLIGFFQEKVYPLLPVKNKDFLLPYMDGTELKFPPQGETDKKTDFLDATRLKKFTIHRNHLEYSLTLREVQCVHRLSQGQTSKEIAAALGLSFRTVEHYLKDIRTKTDCRDKSDLVNLYRQNDLALWFDE
jgi:DNA-binding CsgD family transcriptional regulator